MIVYDLECRSGGHRFEGWFASSDDFARQQEKGLVSCPECGSQDIAKAVQAPRLSRKGNQLPEAAHPPAQRASTASVPQVQSVPATPLAAGPLPPEAADMMRKLLVMQVEALKNSRNVGDKFADEARAMHYGERDSAAIHGHATIEDAQDLLEEGIAIMPLPFPVIPPEQAN